MEELRNKEVDGKKTLRKVKIFLIILLMTIVSVALIYVVYLIVDILVHPVEDLEKVIDYAIIEPIEDMTSAKTGLELVDKVNVINEEVKQKERIWDYVNYFLKYKSE